MEKPKLETGVDKLIDLVKLKKRIDIVEASKILGVPEEIVFELARFLEDEGAITIEYGLSKKYLKERTVSKEEIEDKKQEVADKKSELKEKAEMTLLRLEEEKQDLKKVEQEFSHLKDEIGIEIKDVEQKIGKIKEYEEADKKITEELFRKIKEYVKNIQIVENEIKNEELTLRYLAEEYNKIVKEIAADEQLVEMERNGVKPDASIPIPDSQTRAAAIINDIKKSLSEGKNSEDLKKELKSLGWSDQMIENSLK